MLQNSRGGLYQPGRALSVTDKQRVSNVYMQLAAEQYPNEPTIKSVADLSKCSWDTAKKIIAEERKWPCLGSRFYCGETIGRTEIRVEDP